jgi:antitoxin component of RelBE/YafQ-DinJ toxin-antitoxin module
MFHATLQVPIEKQVRDKATKIAKQRGFSSVQEVVRVFLNQFAESAVDISFTPSPAQLSKKSAERYDRMVDEALSGKVKAKQFSK